MKNKHQQVVDLSNPNEGQFTSTSEITFNDKMKKQSAVEYLVNVVQSCIAPDYIPKEIIQQAKEMEKQQIEQAFADGVDDEYEWHINNQPRTNAEDYYNETFNK
tara:strand:+ start:958 stop:1269 length:312 start_codon:yes stop_codon:yes gene_type:complete